MANITEVIYGILKLIGSGLEELDKIRLKK